MTIGIYKLSFNGTDAVYIGQSINIESRLQGHLNKLKNSKHSNYKVQDAYNKYDIPSLNILEECSIEELNDKEIYWTKEFDSINNGLNIIEAGVKGGYGENHGKSKYTNEQIIQVFKLLINNQEKSFKDISKLTEVSINTIQDIFSLKSHTWLEQEFSEEYNILISLKGTRNKNRNSAKNKGIIYPTIISLEKVVFIIENIAQFARDHNLDRGNLCRLLNGKAKSHKGWTLA